MSAARRPVFLVGFMASGKSSVGRALAGRLGAEFEDTDALVEAAAGTTIEAIFREEGEGRFREREWEALRSLGGRGALVAATGGGLFLGAMQRAFMKARGVTVWLDVPFEVAVARVGSGAGRPLWASADPIAFRAFFEKRRAAYALADVHVAAGVGDPDAIAERIAALVEALRR